MLQGCRWIIAVVLVTASGPALADDEDDRQNLPQRPFAQSDGDERDDDDATQGYRLPPDSLSGGGLYRLPTGVSEFAPAAPSVVPPLADAGPIPWSLDDQQPFVQRFGIAHEAGDGLGFDDGFTTLEFFTPLRGDLVWDNLFGDARIFMHNDTTVGGNFGVGYRIYDVDRNRIWGWNLYYDYRQTEENDFSQAGIGVESLGPLIDFRANAYIPDVDDVVGPVPGVFVGHLLITNRDEIAMRGGDAEVGLCVFDFDQVQGRVYGGGYYFYGHGNDDAAGWKARGEIMALDQRFQVDASVQRDDVFGTTLSVGVALRYLRRGTSAIKPMDHVFYRRPGDAETANIAHRLSAPVERLQNIVLSQQPEIAIDPATGLPLNFLHVVNGGAGTGTFEDPYGTLTAALADAAAGNSIIYTPFGGDFVENITLVPGAQVLSNGPKQFVQTQFGRTRLPFSGASPDLTDLPTLMGDVDMADDSRFSGFEVTGQVTGTGISNITLDHNVVENVGDAVVLTDVDGATLDTLFLESSAGSALILDDTDATLTNVTVNFAAANGIEITTGAVDREVLITDLTILGGAGAGLDANVDGAGSLTLSLAGTNSITSDGNAFDAALGAASTGDLLLSIEGTTFASTGGAGVNIDGSAGAGTIFLTRLADIAILRAVAGGFLVDTATFDADPATAAIDTVSTTLFTVGNPEETTDVTGDGVRLIDPTGEWNIGTLDIFNDGGTGLLVDTKGGGTTFSLVTGPDSTIMTTNGPAMSLDPLDVDLQFDLVQSDDSPASGIFIDTVTGRIRIATTMLNEPLATAIVIQNTPAPLDIQFGITTIDSTISAAFADNVDTSVGNGANLTIDFESLTITGP
jgi:hypothetical protein